MQEPDRAEHSVTAPAEGRYRAIVEASTELISLARPDGTLLYVNPAYARAFGLLPAQLLGCSLFDHVHPADRDAVRELISAVITTGGSRSSENRMLMPAGEERWIAWTNGVQWEGNSALLHSVGRDVTDDRLAEQALRELTLEAQRQSDVLRLVTEAIPATVAVVGADGRYRFANGAFERYCGRPQGQIIGQTAVEVLGAAEVARRRPFMQRALAGEPVSFTLDYPAPDGTTWLQLDCIPLRPGGGAVDGFVGIAQDVTKQKREQDRLTELWQRDALTGLLNRAGFECRLDALTGEGLGASLGMLYIDLDHFKAVNDNHGHPVGDRLLQEAGHRLRGLVRPTDPIARLGGDEFAILLVGVSQQAHVETVAQKVVNAIGQPFDIDGLHLQIGASVGVGFRADTQGGWRELIKRADAMLYQAKAGGRGRHASA